jgi:3-oxoacyl-[acyl-carrier protein] reductase
MTATPEPGARVALVTGAGRGLGAEIARALAAGGCAVAVNDLPGSATAPEIVLGIEKAGGRADFFAADVTSESAVTEMVAAVEARYAPVDVLVVNATGPQPAIGVEELTWRDMLDQLEFFVKSPMLLVQAVLPGMKERRRGRIINVGSDLFERAEPRLSAYSSAKGAQLGLTRTWARELGRYGITVNLVAPGWIPVERHVGATTEELQAYTDDVALRRLGTPADVAAAVVYLASEQAGFVTGERLAVNGGHVIA